jgi:hypothetical protein
MTFLQFSSLVYAMARRLGTPYLEQTDTFGLTELIQRGCNIYAIKTSCLYSNNVAFTPVIGQSQYATFDPATNYSGASSPNNYYLSSPMGFVDQIFLNGAPLVVANPANTSYPLTPVPITQGWIEYGGSTESQVMNIQPNYLTAPNALPAYWFTKAPNTVQFNCPFDKIYSNCWFSGRKYHTPLLTPNQIMDFHAEDIDLAAEVCRNLLLTPLEPELGATLGAVTETKMRTRMAECVKKNDVAGIRGLRSPSYVDTQWG